MSFLAGGNLPNEGPYGAAVAKGTNYLLSCVRTDGYVIAPNEVNNDKGMYGHGIATIALGELYGQTGDPNIRQKLERAIHLIVSTQQTRAERGMAIFSEGDGGGYFGDGAANRRAAGGEE